MHCSWKIKTGFSYLLLILVYQQKKNKSQDSEQKFASCDSPVVNLNRKHKNSRTLGSFFFHALIAEIKTFIFKMVFIQRLIFKINKM